MVTMNLHTYRRLQAEQKAIANMLAEIPEDRVIDRISLEARMRSVEEELASQPPPERQPVRARLTFRGRPVVGHHGMFAEFGATAVAGFVKAVSSIGAAADQPLGARGQLPNQDDFRLLITGTALGSFGFELEEAAQEDLTLFPAESPLESAIARTQAIMRATLESDEELTETLADVDPRALDALRTFLDELANAEAVCTLEFRDQVFRYADVAQLRGSAARLRQDNIHEKDLTLTGRFLGVLPEHRRFELRLAESGEVISGRIGKHIDDAARINESLGQPVNAVVHTQRVGQGTPRYTLIAYMPAEQPPASSDSHTGGT